MDGLFNELAVPNEYVYEINRCVYGIPFSGRTFRCVIEELMHTLGFKCCVSNKCVYIKWVNGKRLVVVAYVDDLIRMTSCDKLRQWWKDSMAAGLKKVTSSDEFKWILNMKVNMGIDPNGTTWIELIQELAITKIAEAVGLPESRKCDFSSGRKIFCNYSR